MRELLKTLLKRDEGFRPYVYEDHLGFATIGYGRLIDKRRGGGITEEEGAYLLNNDITTREQTVLGYLPWVSNLDPARYAVIMSMAFQLGMFGLLSFKNTLRAVQEGRWDDAAEGMLRSKWAQQTPQRVYRLAEAMRTGDPAAFRLTED